jgi:Cdc6-like AAA superfamily ATPase
VINTLEKKEVLVSFEKQEFRMPYAGNVKINREEIVLTDEQNVAFDGLMELANSANGETALLYGVTGSGKTKVFLKLVDEISAASREQDIGARQITNAIQQLDSVVQQNASASEELASMATKLTENSEELLRSIKFFKLRDEDAEEVRAIEYKA